MIGIDMIGASAPRSPASAIVVAPYHVVLNPPRGQSTVFGDPLRGIPSGVARVAITGGAYTKPDPTFMADANVWDDSKGSPPNVVVYFLNGSKQSFAGLQAVTTQGGTYRPAAMQPRGWFSRTFGIGVDTGEDFGPVSPQQLAQLDRALTPAEQKAVDDWQIAQANAAQKAEESKPFINPKTGKVTRVTTTYSTEKPPAETDDSKKKWYLIIGGVVVVFVGAVLTLKGRR